jgi:hypothetical protein
MTDQPTVHVEHFDLGDLIAALEAALAETGDRILPIGFGNPHSWRGDYSELAFEPMRDVKLSEMVESAKSALGATYDGWKGGSYTMTKYTSCRLDYEGRSGGETIGALMLALLLRGGSEPDRG